jgi:hypothetical protein
MQIKKKVHGAESLRKAESLKKFTVFYGTPRLITVFTRAGHWTFV